MKRFLSALLACVLGFGPIWMAIPASADARHDARLPACCRRNGAHRCAMNMGLPEDSAAEAGTPESMSRHRVSSSQTCPCFPHRLAAHPCSAHAIAPAAGDAPQLLVQSHSAQAAGTQARISRRRTEPKRGPPALQLA